MRVGRAYAGGTALLLTLGLLAAGAPEAEASTAGQLARARRVCGELRPGGLGVRGGAHRPAPVPLPADGQVVAVLRCQLRPVVGPPARRSVVLREATTGLADVVSALHAADEPRPEGTACPAYVVFPPEDVTVRLADGRLLRPRLPLTACGMPQPAVLLAVSRLRSRTLAVVPQLP